MDNKYYTPTIEEFHVGFEFEKYDSRQAIYVDEGVTNWHKHKYDTKSIRLSQIGSHLFERTIRVKYLNKEDIESLGWVYEKDLRDEYDICFKKGSMILEYTELIKAIRIYYLVEASDDADFSYKRAEIIFSGTIKNKSELKRLMKQLGIYE